MWEIDENTIDDTRKLPEEIYIKISYEWQSGPRGRRE